MTEEQMRVRKLLFAYRPFANLIRCTATSSTLRELASALARGGPPALQEALRNYGSAHSVVVAQGSITSLSGFSDRRLTLALDDCEKLVGILTTLAKGPDRGCVSLASVGLLTPEPSGIDLELCKLDEVVSLSQDYETDHLGGALWESELSHNVPTLEQLSRVREIVLGWARPTSERWERKVFVQSDQGEEECALSQALQRLIDPADQAFQINIYPDHPLVVKYGSPYTDAKVWVEAEHTRVILSQCCAWSGEYRADISNFFSYLRLFRSLATALGARGASFVDSRVLEPRLLDDLQTMWDLFRWGHGEHLEGAEIPRWVRDEFELAWTVAA